MDGFNWSSLVVPLGITTLTLLLITAATGLFRRKLRRRFLTVHKVFAWATVGVALCHAALVMVLIG
jgi:hypothetical protein